MYILFKLIIELYSMENKLFIIESNKIKRKKYNSYLILLKKNITFILIIISLIIALKIIYYNSKYLQLNNMIYKIYIQ